MNGDLDLHAPDPEHMAHRFSRRIAPVTSTASAAPVTALTSHSASATLLAWGLTYLLVFLADSFRSGSIGRALDRYSRLKTVQALSSGRRMSTANYLSVIRTVFVEESIIDGPQDSGPKATTRSDSPDKR